MPKRKPGYYKIYESAGINTNRFLAGAAKEAVKRLGPPYEPNVRGRPCKLDSEKAAVLVIVQAAQDKTFRSAEDIADQIHGTSVDHVTIWRYFGRVSADYIKRAVQLLYNLIHIKLKSVRMFMMDSTGIICERSGALLKLHVLVCYFIELGILVIAAAEVTLFFKHDAPVGEELVETAKGDGNPLLGDRGYDSNALRKRSRRHGFRPNIKFRRQSAPTTQEQIQGFVFNEDEYRMRGVIEGLFGGGQVRYGNKTRCRLKPHRIKDVLLKALGFNLRAYLRTQAIYCSTLIQRSFYLLMGIMKQRPYKTPAEKAKIDLELEHNKWKGLIKRAIEKKTPARIEIKEKVGYKGKIDYWV